MAENIGSTTHRPFNSDNRNRGGDSNPKKERPADPNKFALDEEISNESKLNDTNVYEANEPRPADPNKPIFANPNVNDLNIPQLEFEEERADNSLLRKQLLDLKRRNAKVRADYYLEMQKWEAEIVRIDKTIQELRRVREECQSAFKAARSVFTALRGCDY